MTLLYSRRSILATLSASVATPVLANAPVTSLRPHLRPDPDLKPLIAEAAELIEQANLHGDVSFAVAKVGAETLLESHNETLGLPPASVSKSLTALYALDVLGENFQFETRLLATGPIVNGFIQGDLILAGGADPTLDTDDLYAMAKSLKEAGVTGATGRFVVYGGALPSVDTIDGGQPVHVGYSPAISGVCLNFNRVYFDWLKTANGFDVAMDARSAAHRPPVRFARMELSDRTGPVFAYKAGEDRDFWSVSQKALNDKGGRWLPVRQPEIYAGEVFRWSARNNGISLAYPVKSHSFPRGDVLVAHKSEPLKDVLRDMLKYSTNVTAEMAGLMASIGNGTAVGSLSGSGRAMSQWAEQTLGLKGSKLIDHSGLGDRSRLQSKELALALARRTTHETLTPILKKIQLRNKDGAPNKAHPIGVIAKTGTLNFVSGLAGYMTMPNGEEFAFAIFAADTEKRASLKREQRDRPRGAKSWNARAKTLQQNLIERWGAVYAGDS